MNFILVFYTKSNKNENAKKYLCKHRNNGVPRKDEIVIIDQKYYKVLEVTWDINVISRSPSSASKLYNRIEILIEPLNWIKS